jgi:hypothetical protein
MPQIEMTVRMVRTAKVPTVEVRGIVPEDEAKVLGLVKAVEKRFHPLAEGIEFYARDDGITLVSMEAMSFHIKAPGIPFAGMVKADPIDPAAMHRVDGALNGELTRLGLFALPSEYETRFVYEGGIQ